MNLTLPLEDQTLETPKPNQALIDALCNRRSSKILEIDASVGPNDAELKDILSIAVRVPDHGKLAPWRFIVINGEARKKLGAELAQILKAQNPNMDNAHFKIESEKFLRGHTIVTLVSSPKESIKAPIWEQELSAGALGYNLILACNGFGYSATWLSEWPMFEPTAREVFNLSPNERIAGFFYIGRAKTPPTERGRPNVTELLEYWR